MAIYNIGLLKKAIIFLSIFILITGCRIDPNIASGAVKELNRQIDTKDAKIVSRCYKDDNVVTCYEY